MVVLINSPSGEYSKTVCSEDVSAAQGGGGGGGGGERRGLRPRNDVLTTCKAVNPRASQRYSKEAVCFLMISTLALSVG